MAEKSIKDPMQEKVTVTIPYVSGEPDTVYIGLNGKGYTIQRGQEVELPKPVYDVYLNSQKMKQANQEKIREMVAAANRPKMPSF